MGIKYLGIDPGFELMGFSIIDVEGSTLTLLECGVVRTLRTDSFPQRLRQIHDDLESILKRHPDIRAAGIEELFFAKNVKTAIQVSHARGVILFTLAQFPVTLYDIKPVEVKSLVTGSGRADKKTVQRTVQFLFHLEEIPQPDDAADAIAIAVAVSAIDKQAR